MLNLRTKKFALSATKKNNILILVFSEKSYWTNNKKTIAPPPLQVKWSVPNICNRSPVYVEKREELAVCTNNETRGQSIARLKLPVDIAKTQTSFNNLF